VVALDLESGNVLWKHPLPSPPVPWAMAVNREGRVVVTLENGLVLCFG
jgi:outer membrane protein assembly factor BamB